MVNRRGSRRRPTRDRFIAELCARCAAAPVSRENSTAAALGWCKPCLDRAAAPAPPPPPEASRS